VRFYPVFEYNPHVLSRVLDAFVRLMHTEHTRVRSRSWYLFNRLARPLRVHVAPVARTVVQSIGDLLTIRAELPEEDNDDMSSDQEDKSADALFTSQLYLFETIGNIASAPNVPLEEKVLFANSVINPLLVDLQTNLPIAQGQDPRAMLQVQHVIRALGTLAQGFAPAKQTPSENPDQIAPSVADEFVQAAEGVLVALESLKSSVDIRTASRQAFTRLISILGKRLLKDLPRWIEGLISADTSKDEMAMFLRVLDQILFAFKSEIFDILDALLTPLLQRVFVALAEETTGTDDEIQLAELRREYLQFLLVILNQDLGSVLVSNGKEKFLRWY
jgi:exportin-T